MGGDLSETARWGLWGGEPLGMTRAEERGAESQTHEDNTNAYLRQET